MKKLATLLLVFSLILALPGCTASQPKEPDNAPEQSETPSEGPITDLEYWANLAPDADVTWTSPNNYKRIGMVVPDGTSEFYVQMCKTIGEIVEKEGYSFSWIGATDSEAAINAVETWVTQGVDALILLVQDTACENVALKAMEQGVLVVLGSATFSSYHVWCNQDYYQIGKNIAKMASDDMKERFGDDAAYIVIGASSVEFQTLKTSGIIDGMDEYYPNGTRYELMNNIPGIQDDVEALLTQHPEIKAVVTWHAVFALSALAGVTTLNRNDPEKFAVYGSQMTEQSLLEIKNPESCYVSDTWMGDQGRQYANVVLELLNGGTVKHHDAAPDIVVNADNIDTYYQDYYKKYGDTYKY